MTELQKSHDRLVKEVCILRARLEKMIMYNAELQVENRQQQKVIDGIRILLR